MERKMPGCRCATKWCRLVMYIAAVTFVSSMSAVDGKIIHRIDTHTHYLPPFYFDLLESKGLNSGGRPNPKWNVTEHVALMDHLKIDVSVLSISTPGARLTPFDVEDGRKLARELNEYGHMLVQTYPGRFQFFATLVLPDVEGSIEEAVYALDNLNAAGVILLGNAHGEYLGNKKLDPLMEVLNTRGATVFVHPNSFDVARVSNNEEEDIDLPTFAIDFLLDTTRAATNLVLKNVTGRYPNIKFLLAHSGGFLPFAAYRMAGALTFLTKGRVLDLVEELRKFYVDTALASSPSALPSTLSFLPENHITFGSDYPYAPYFGIKAVTDTLDEYPLVDDLREKINFLNADQLFEKSLSHWRKIWQQDEARSVSQPDIPSSLFRAL